MPRKDRPRGPFCHSATLLCRLSRTEYKEEKKAQPACQAVCAWARLPWMRRPRAKPGQVRTQKPQEETYPFLSLAALPVPCLNRCVRRNTKSSLSPSVSNNNLWQALLLRAL